MSVKAFSFQRDPVLEPFRFGANEIKEENQTEGLYIWEERQFKNQRNAN